MNKHCSTETTLQQKVWPSNDFVQLSLGRLSINPMWLPIPDRRDLVLSVEGGLVKNHSGRDGQDRRAARGCTEPFLFAVRCEDRRRTLSNVFTGKYGYVLNRQAHQPWLCYGFGTLLPKSATKMTGVKTSFHRGICCWKETSTLPLSK